MVSPLLVLYMHIYIHTHTNIFIYLRYRSSCPYIGDIMKTFSPYLKIYTDYVKTFHEALDLLETWYSKNPSFSQMLRSLTLTEKCYVGICCAISIYKRKIFCCLQKHSCILR